MSVYTLKPCATADCSGVVDPCGGTPPASCECALLIPPAFPTDINTPVNPDSPYASAADAQTVIDAQVADCLVYINLTSGGSITAKSASATGNQLDFSVTGNPDGIPFATQAFMWASFECVAGSVITISKSGFGGSMLGRIYACDGTLVEEINSPSGTDIVFTALAAGGYIIHWRATSSGFPPETLNFSVASSDTTVFNPVIAQWDDSGTTRKLEACPKLYMPTLPLVPGTLYASCADAATALGFVASCIGLILPTIDTRSASDLGTSIELSGSDASHAIDAMTLYASINAEAGETLSFAWDVSASGSFGADGTITCSIFDDSDASVEVLSDTMADVGGTGTLTSAALPYTGRYTVEINFTPGFDDVSTASADITITSSGAISANPAQALYDVGLTCPARLNCGDSC